MAELIKPNDLAESLIPEHRHELTIQGKLVKWKDSANSTRPKAGIKRGKVTSFSKAARKRMLEWIATVDWEAVLPCKFLTATYPDSCGIVRLDRVHYHKQQLWREVEQELAARTACLWRIELEDRKSGKYVGEFLAHLHMLAFNVAFLDQWKFKVWWKRIIGVDPGSYVRCDVKKCDSEKEAGIYLAKYSAKIDPLFALVDDAYCNIGDGRLWGKLREELVTRCEPEKVYLPDTEAAQEFREKHTDFMKGWKVTVVLPDGELKERSLGNPLSFTLLGERAVDFQEELRTKLAHLQEGLRVRTVADVMSVYSENRLNDSKIQSDQSQDDAT